MKYAPLLLIALAGCPNGDDDENAPVLWLAPDGSETNLRLAEGRPPPF